MPPAVQLDDLLQALAWVSDDTLSEHAAYVSRESGRVYWLSEEGPLDDEDDWPDDIEDEGKFVPVPHRRELDLGRRLALQFTEEYLPDEVDRVARYFSRSGAYGRFKDRLADLDQLDAWHGYEEAAVARALRDWAASNGFEVRDDANARG